MIKLHMLCIVGVNIIQEYRELKLQVLVMEVLKKNFLL